MKTVVALALILLAPDVVRAQDCRVSLFPQVSYTSAVRGTVVLHLVPAGFDTTASDLVCLAGNELIRRASDVPNRFVVGLVSEDWTKVQVIQWDLEKNFLTILDVRLPEGEGAGKGSFTTYDSPLDRLSELLVSKPLPTPGSLGAAVTTNYITASKETVKALLEGR